jgi:hypothetical protein
MTELMRNEFIALTAWLGRFVVAHFGPLGRSLPEETNSDVARVVGS